MRDDMAKKTATRLLSSHIHH